jgi:succinoglycan biosynthesis protein ExoL
MTQVTYFASDLADAATIRRVRILRHGGATVRLLGFRRTAEPIREVEGVPAIDLGQTFNGQLVSRMRQIARVATKNWQEIIAGSDVVLGRNLEMATLADIARTRAKVRCRLAYECLDIHAAFLGGGKAKLLQAWERTLLRRCSALITSSSSYVENYFRHLGTDLPEIILAENKRVLPTEQRSDALAMRQPPWRIGWFGGLRCVDSFHILQALAQRMPQLVSIHLRGRIQNPAVQSLIDHHLPMPNMSYDGPYTETDLAAMYRSVDLTWAIEYFGRGGNSDWCLANRIYEGGYYNSPTIALAGTATADWLVRHGSGIILDDPTIDLPRFLINLTPGSYRALARQAAEVPTDALAWTDAGCYDFVRRLAG